MPYHKGRKSGNKAAGDKAYSYNPPYKDKKIPKGVRKSDGYFDRYYERRMSGSN